VDRQRTHVHGGLERHEHRGRYGTWPVHSASGAGLAGATGEGEQGRGRPVDGSPRWNPRRRGDAMGLETATAAASRRWRCKRLGGEESEGKVWRTTVRGGVLL
jgi:hypothetical protein